MGAFSNYLEGKIVDHFLRGTAVTAPSTVYVGLFTSDPGEATGGTEASYGGYSRQAATFSAIDSNGQTKNTAAISFPASTSTTDQTLTHFVIFDAATSGNRLFYGQLSKSKALSQGDSIAFAAGNLVITLD